MGGERMLLRKAIVRIIESWTEEAFDVWRELELKLLIVTDVVQAKCYANNPHGSICSPPVDLCQDVLRE
jgi:hypothetical protein